MLSNVDKDEPTVKGLKEAMRLLGVNDPQVHIKVWCSPPPQPCCGCIYTAMYIHTVDRRSGQAVVIEQEHSQDCSDRVLCAYMSRAIDHELLLCQVDMC